MNERKMNLEIVKFVKTLMESKVFYDQIESQDFSLFVSSAFSLDLLTLYKKFVNKHGWMNWNEFKKMAIYEDSTREELFEYPSQIMEDEDLEQFDSNLNVFLVDCFKHQRKLLASEITRGVDLFCQSEMNETDCSLFAQGLQDKISKIIHIKQNDEEDEIDFREETKLHEHLLNTNQKLKEGHRFAMGLFEQYIPPVMPGHFICMQAEPKRGKSTWKREVSLYNIVRGLNGIYISTEMTAQQNMCLFACIPSGEDVMDLFSTKIVEDNERYQKHREQYVEFLSKHPDSYFKFIRTSGELTDVQAKIMKHKNILNKQDKELDYVIIDHILDMKMKGKGAKKDQEVFASIIEEMYDFGVLNQYITVTSQHLKRDAVKIVDGVQKIQSGGGFGTSAMEKKATLILGATQTEQQKFNNQISVEILYNRYGPSGVRAIFETDLTLQRFIATEPEYYDPNRLDKKRKNFFKSK